MALRTRHAALALVAACALFAAVVGESGAAPSGTTASPGSSSSTTTTAPLVPVLRSNATVTIAVSHLPTELNPWAPGGADPLVGAIMAQVWPQASIVDSKGNTTICFAEVPNCPEPLFSTAEDVSVTPQTIEYTIAPKAVWSDGTPVTAADFVALWAGVEANAAILPVTAPVAGYLDIASITPSDHGSKFSVVFRQPYADWPALFTNVPPSHIANKYGFAKAFSTTNPARILSAGPYRISRIVPGKSIILDRNSAFWSNRPSVKRIIFRVYPNQQAILAGLASGAITLAALPPSPAIDAALTASPQLQKKNVTAPVLWQLAFNVARPALSAAVVRQAIAKVINRHELIANSVGLDTAFGQSTGNRLFPTGAPGSQGNDGAYGAVDLDEATSLLASVGDVTDADGYVHTAAGPKLTLTLTVPSGNTEMRTIALTIQAELLTAGITVIVRPVLLSTMLGKTLPKGQYEMALVPYPVSPYPSTMASLYVSPIGPTPPTGVDPTATAPIVAPTPTGATGTTATSTTTTTNALPTTPTSSIGVTSAPLVLPTVSGEAASLALGTVTRNTLGFTDPALNGLFAEASVQLNTAAELSLYDEIDTELWADMPTLPLFQQPLVLVSRIALLGATQSASPAQYLWNAENWAVEKNPTPVTTTTDGSGS